MTTITLPWPSTVLSPNARAHWSRKAREVRSARLLSEMMTRQEFGPTKPRWPGASVTFSFCPPDKRRRDLDNCISSTKAHRDGIADALGVDDSKFQCAFAFGAPVKGGAVRVEITPIQVTES